MAAHSVRYSPEYNYSDPVEIRSFDKNLEILRWFFQHSLPGGGWITFDFLSKSDGELGQLRTSVPDLGIPKRDLSSFRTILHHLGTLHRFTDPQVAQIVALITAWSGQAGDILRSYYPDEPPDANLYLLLTKWARLMESVLQYFMRKLSNSCRIMDSYAVFRAKADLLQPLMNQMIIGRTTKLVCQQAGGVAMDAQTICKAAIDDYFATIPPWEDDLALANFLSTLLPGTLVQPLTIAQMKTAKTARNLHRRITHELPESVAEWAEYGAASKIVNEFFKFILTTAADTQSQAISKLPNKKEEVKLMKARLELMKADDISPEELGITLEDLNLLSVSINSMYEQGIEWTDANFCCTRSDLNTWRKDTLVKKKECEKLQKKMIEDEKARSEIYAKNLKSRQLPDINDGNWSRFLSLWKVESENYPSEAQKLSVLRSRLVVPSDKTSTESMSRLEDVLSFLYARYGSPNSIMTDTLDQLENLGNPSTDAKLEENMVSISGALAICENEADLCILWSSARTGRVVNKSLSESMRISFWDSYETFKSDCLTKRIADGVATPLDGWEQCFDKHFPTERILFLHSFLKKQLGIMRSMGVGISNKKCKDAKVKLVDRAESWLCPLCKTSHKSDSRPVRPYLSICETFRSMNVDRRIQACKQHRICQVCTCSLDNKWHKESTNGCPKKDQFKCTVCVAPACFLHCNMTCRQQAKSKQTRQKADKTGRGGGGDRGRAPPGGGQSNDGGRPGNGSVNGGCPPDNSLVPYQQNNRNLGQGGYGPANHWQAFKTEDHPCEGPNGKNQSQNWLSSRNYFQPVFLAGILAPAGTAHCLCLSDSGSSIAFTDASYMSEIGILPTGQWQGVIETINSCSEVSLPFFKIAIKLDKSQSYILFALSTSGLGYRDEIPDGIIHDVAVMFKCDPTNFYSGGGRIRLLLGQDSGSLLLRPLTHISGKEICKYLPEVAKDLSIQRTPASPKLSICGSIGKGDPMGSKTSIFHNTVRSSHFTFYTEPTPVEIQSLYAGHPKTTFSALSTGTTPLSPASPFHQPPGGGGSGTPGGLLPSLSPAPGPVQSSQAPQGSSDKQSTGSNLQKLTQRIRGLLLKPRSVSQFLPKFPGLACFLISVSLVVRSGEANPLPMMSSCFSQALSSENLSRNIRSNASKTTDLYSADSHNSSAVSGTPAWVPTLSNETATTLVRKRSKPVCQMFSLNALGTVLACLTNPQYLEKCHALLNVDDPDSKALLSLQLCDGCQERSRRCQACKWLNSQHSLQELAELDLIKKCISVKSDPENPGMHFVEAAYPFIGDLPTLYSPEKSNYKGAISTTRSLFRRLHRIGKAKDFDDEIQKSIAESHMRILTKVEEAQVLSDFHCFSFLNFQLKDASASQKVRPVTNSSSSHPSGSFNSRTCKGPNMLNNLKVIFENFRLKRWVAVSDLKRCYRCMRTNHTTNVMRLMVYPAEPLNPSNDEFVILYLQRATYGDMVCSTLLECILRDVVAPACSTELGRAILEDQRYVDDLLSGDDDSDVLMEAMIDVSNTLNKFGFSFKHLITNFTKYSADGSSVDGAIAPEMTEEKIFHHTWMFRQDLLANFPIFNCHKKSRGSYMGPGLLETDVSNLQITKRLASRLMGQAFSIDGSFLSPLKAVFSVLFSRICSITNEWDEEISCAELKEEFKLFLTILKTKLPLLTPMPRCVIPAGYHSIGINGHSDGSSFLSSYCFYILSTSAELVPAEFASLIAGASAKVKHHSVVGNEMMSITLLVESLTEYVFNHHSSLFNSSTVRFPINFGMDSECILFSLNPLKISKSVLVKNAVRAIHSFCKDLTSRWTCIDINFYHVASAENVADHNSKIPPDYDPCRVIETSLWRHGLPQFLDQSFPPEEKIYLKVANGELNWVGKNSVPVDCICVVCSSYTTCVSSKSTMVSDPVLSPDWHLLLDSLPVLTTDHVSALLKRRNIKMCVRSLSRYLAICLPAEILKVLHVPDKWYGAHLLSTLDLEDCTQISTDEIPGMLQKMAFLTLVKTSNAHFPPKSSIQSEIMGGVYVSTTRYSLEAMHKVFKTQLIPLVSSSDKMFLYRLYQNAHIVRNPAHEHGLGPAHLSVSLTTQLMKTGVSAVLVGKIRTLVSTWISKCPHCIRLGSVERNFTHSAEDPRILSLIGEDSPIFQCVSIDIFTEVYVLAHSRARGRPSYPVAILVVADLMSKTVCFVVLDGAKMIDVAKGLQLLALRYRMPDIMVVDAGPQLRNLSDQSELLKALSMKEIKIVGVPQGHQFSSFSERMIAEAKKILNSLREDVNASMYRQPQTLLELLGKLTLVESVLSLRPILGHTKDLQQVVLTPRQLTHPFLSCEQLNSNAIDILRGVFNLDESVSQLGRAGHDKKQELQIALIDYLQEAGVRYNKETSGNKQKKSYSSVLPQVNDIVLFKDSEKRSRFGVILQLCSQNQVIIRSVLNRVPIERKFHIRVLTLLFRPSEWVHDIPI